MNKLEIKTGINILKPAHEVYEAIVDPNKMCNYFISESSGRMEEGKTLTWKFPEMDLTFPVRVKKTEKDKFVSFAWDGLDGKELLVEMNISSKNNDSTFLEIKEKERENNNDGINWLKSNTEGWANFLACLKAYLEYGINLRKGAFGPSQMPEKK